MASIAQVRRAAARTGCDFEVDGNLITLHAPAGFAFEGEYTMLGREAERGYLTKGDIYDEMMEAMDDIRKEGR